MVILQSPYVICRPDVHGFGKQESIWDVRDFCHVFGQTSLENSKKKYQKSKIKSDTLKNWKN